MVMHNENKVKLYIGLIAALLLTAGGYFGYRVTENVENIIPRTKVQQGYVRPSQLEIKVEDLVGDGNKATVLQYQGRQYLFIDEGGVPTAQPYEVIPAQTQPAHIKLLDNSK